MMALRWYDPILAFCKTSTSIDIAILYCFNTTNTPPGCSNFQYHTPGKNAALQYPPSHPIVTLSCRRMWRRAPCNHSRPAIFIIGILSSTTHIFVFVFVFVHRPVFLSSSRILSALFFVNQFKSRWLDNGRSDGVSQCVS